MNNVFNLADFRAKRKAPPPPKPPTKEDIAEGVVKAFRKMLSPMGAVTLQSAIRLVAAQGARSIVKQVSRQGDSIGSFSRFQFFGVKEGSDFVLLGRVNGISSADELGFRSAMFLIEPASLAAIHISESSNIAKNNTFCTLITLPMSDFYTL